MIIDWEVARIFIAAVILIIIGLVIILATKKDHLHGGGGGGHGGGGGWHGGGGGWRDGGRWGGRGRRIRGSGGGWGGWWWPWYNYDDYPDYIVNSPDSNQKIGYAISDDGTKTIDILFAGYHDGEFVYVFTNQGTSVGSQKMKLPLKNKDRVPLTIDGTTSVFMVYLAK